MKIRLLWIVALFWFVGMVRASEVRVAILAEREGLVLADLLAPVLSAWPEIVLVEREEIERVRREQSAGTTGVALGRMLGAHGLIVLEPHVSSSERQLSVQFIAVAPGVIVVGESLDLPLKEPDRLAGHLLRRFRPLIPKLIVPPVDAIPISLLGMRSPVKREGTEALERDLMTYLYHRLIRVPEFFVTERRRMDLLAQEKAWNMEDEARFWSSAHILDGTVKELGGSEHAISVELSITEADGRATTIEATGRRDRIAALSETLSAHVVTALGGGAGDLRRDTVQEAQEYYEEAQWAYNAALFERAEQAATASWALGPPSLDVLSLRIRSLVRSVHPGHILGNVFYGHPWPEPKVMAALGLENMDQNVDALLHAFDLCVAYKARYNGEHPHDWQSLTLYAAYVALAAMDACRKDDLGVADTTCLHELRMRVREVLELLEDVDARNSRLLALKDRFPWLRDKTPSAVPGRVHPRGASAARGRRPQLPTYTGGQGTFPLRCAWDPSAHMRDQRGRTYGQCSMDDTRYAYGRLWLLAMMGRERHHTVIVVDPSSFEAIAIPVPMDTYPVKRWDGMPRLRVSARHMAYFWSKQLATYDFEQRAWSSVSVPRVAYSAHAVTDTTLYLGMSSADHQLHVDGQSGVLAVDLDKQVSRVVCSSRRRPARTLLDDTTPYDVYELFTSANGALFARVGFFHQRAATLFRFKDNDWHPVFEDAWNVKVHEGPAGTVVTGRRCIYLIKPDAQPRTLVSAATTGQSEAQWLGVLPQLMIADAAYDGRNLWLLATPGNVASQPNTLYLFAEGHDTVIRMPLAADRAVVSEADHLNGRWLEHLLVTPSGVHLVAHGGIVWTLPLEDIREFTKLDSLRIDTIEGPRAEECLVAWQALGQEQGYKGRKQDLSKDTDQDGLPDAWESRYGLDPKDNGSGQTRNGPDGNPDGDCRTNLQEYEAGDDPTDVDSNDDGYIDGWGAAPR